MEDKKQYGVIHELGDYSKFEKLSDEDSEILQEQMTKEQKEKEEENN